MQKKIKQNRTMKEKFVAGQKLYFADPYLFDIDSNKGITIYQVEFVKHFANNQVEFINKKYTVPQYAHACYLFVSKDEAFEKKFKSLKKFCEDQIEKHKKELEFIKKGQLYKRMISRERVSKLKQTINEKEDC